MGARSCLEVLIVFVLMVAIHSQFPASIMCGNLTAEHSYTQTIADCPAIKTCGNNQCVSNCGPTTKFYCGATCWNSLQTIQHTACFAELLTSVSAATPAVQKCIEVYEKIGRQYTDLKGGDREQCWQHEVLNSLCGTQQPIQEPKCADDDDGATRIAMICLGVGMLLILLAVVAVFLYKAKPWKRNNAQRNQASPHYSSRASELPDFSPGAGGGLTPGGDLGGIGGGGGGSTGWGYGEVSVVAPHVEGQIVQHGIVHNRPNRTRQPTTAHNKMELYQNGANGELRNEHSAVASSSAIPSNAHSGTKVQTVPISQPEGEPDNLAPPPSPHEGTNPQAVQAHHTPLPLLEPTVVAEGQQQQNTDDGCLVNEQAVLQDAVNDVAANHPNNNLDRSVPPPSPHSARSGDKTAAVCSLSTVPSMDRLSKRLGKLPHPPGSASSVVSSETASTVLSCGK
eukprot:TRINITY_DN68145_c9_g8_i1.p1 TRINITY_DN68145_c9_g8~~TRINITY_DN68145_c9_g8_i1.p1  ORF type:complete len:453 (-),score=54.89 TRINITY_DN68145_c9_g8_i1:634-1992(-)